MLSLDFRSTNIHVPENCLISGLYFSMHFMHHSQLLFLEVFVTVAVAIAHWWFDLLCMRCNNVHTRFTLCVYCIINRGCIYRLAVFISKSIDCSFWQRFFLLNFTVVKFWTFFCCFFNFWSVRKPSLTRIFWYTKEIFSTFFSPSLPSFLSIFWAKLIGKIRQLAKCSKCKTESLFFRHHKHTKAICIGQNVCIIIIIIIIERNENVWCEINRKLYLRVSFWSGCWNVLYVWVWVCLYMGCHLNFVRTLNLCCFTLPNNLAIHNSFANTDRLLWLW